MDQRLRTRNRCIDALDRIDQVAKRPDGYPYDPETKVIRHSVEALTWILQNTGVNPEKLEVFVSSMCEAYGVEGP